MVISGWFTWNSPQVFSLWTVSVNTEPFSLQCPQKEDLWMIGIISSAEVGIMAPLSFTAWAQNWPDCKICDDCFSTVYFLPCITIIVLYCYIIGCNIPSEQAWSWIKLRLFWWKTTSSLPPPSSPPLSPITNEGSKLYWNYCHFSQSQK